MTTSTEREATEHRYGDNYGKRYYVQHPGS